MTGPPDGPRRPDAASEARLEELRRQADRDGRVDADGVRAAGSPLPEPPEELPPPGPDTGYWGQPIVKAPVWTWEVPLYFFVGGAAGAAAVLAAGAELLGPARPGLAWSAHVLALAGAAVSGALLVSDLGRPARFLNMLRVFKWRSPMSVGAWVLAVFGGLAGVATLAHVAGIGHGAISVAAGLSGAILASYTGVLLGATAIPAWASQRALLPVHFTVGALGTAAALLELVGHRDAALGVIGLGASGAETLLLVAAWLHRRPWTRPLRRGVSGRLLGGGKLLSGPVALTVRLLGGEPARWLSASAFAVGALLSRWGWLAAGRASAADPADTLEWARSRGPADDL